MIKGFLTTDEAAERLGNITAARVRQMIRSGVISDVKKVGNVNLIPERVIKKLEETVRKAGRPAKPKPDK